MNSCNTIILVHDKKPFRSLSLKLLQNRDISFEAKGLLIDMLSRSPTWELVIETLYQEAIPNIRPKCQKDKIGRILNELVHFGYAHKLYPFYNQKIGRFAGSLWFFAETAKTPVEWSKYVQNQHIISKPDKRGHLVYSWANQKGDLQKADFQCSVNPTPINVVTNVTTGYNEVNDSLILRESGENLINPPVKNHKTGLSPEGTLLLEWWRRATNNPTYVPNEKEVKRIETEGVSRYRKALLVYPYDNIQPEISAVLIEYLQGFIFNKTPIGIGHLVGKGFWEGYIHQAMLRCGLNNAQVEKSE